MVYMNEIFTKSGEGMQNIVCLKWYLTDMYK